MRNQKAAHLYFKIEILKGSASRLRKNRICIFL